MVGSIDNAGHVGGAIVGGLLGLVYVMQYRAIRQQQLFANEASSAPNTLANSEISGITNHQSTPPSSRALSGKIVRSSYMILTVLFIGIYWWLHTNFMQLLNTALPSIIH